MKIVVLAGGLSTERDVSINSGTQVSKALREQGHQAVLLDIFLGYGRPGEDISHVFEGGSLTSLSDSIDVTDPDLEQVKSMRSQNPECLFGPNVLEICKQADIVYMGLHGADGENGKVQAVLDLFGIPYTGSGCLGSAMAMDKVIAKKILQASGVPVPKGFSITEETRDRAQQDVTQVGFPCVVKPSVGGSSVGVSIAHNLEEYRQALEVAFGYDDEVIVEEYIKGREFSVGVLAGKVLPIIEIIPKEGFYDYKTKYQAGMAQDVCPASLEESQTGEMQRLALQAYRELRLQVYGRVDFLMDESGCIYCLEANTLPGMTPTSLLPQEAKAEGISYGDLCETIIQESLRK